MIKGHLHKMEECKKREKGCPRGYHEHRYMRCDGERVYPLMGTHVSMSMPTIIFIQALLLATKKAQAYCTFAEALRMICVPYGYINVFVHKQFTYMRRLEGGWVKMGNPAWMTKMIIKNDSTGLKLPEEWDGLDLIDFSFYPMTATTVPDYVRVGDTGTTTRPAGSSNRKPKICVGGRRG